MSSDVADAALQRLDDVRAARQLAEELDVPVERVLHDALDAYRQCLRLTRQALAEARRAEW